MWRTLTAPQKVFAELALKVASNQIRDLKPGIAEDDLAAQLVAHDMVKTAIVTGRYPGHSSYQESAGGANLSGNLAIAGGALELTDTHRRMLGLPVAAGGTPKWFFGDRECTP
nr:phage Gp19/Gp15/Gp42 family protein [Hoyosella altamirensis]